MDGLYEETSPIICMQGARLADPPSPWPVTSNYFAEYPKSVILWGPGVVLFVSEGMLRFVNRNEPHLLSGGLLLSNTGVMAAR